MPTDALASHVAAAASHPCTQCGKKFGSRNQLFRHLSASCDPSASSALGFNGVTHRLALLVSYVGTHFRGSSGLAQTAGACGAESLCGRDGLTVEGAVVAAARRALGEDVVLSSTQAVRTEKGASAAANWFVLNLCRPAAGGVDWLVAELAREEPRLRLLAPPTLAST